jgi:hypothetical protein
VACPRRRHGAAATFDDVPLCYAPSTVYHSNEQWRTTGGVTLHFPNITKAHLCAADVHSPLPGAPAAVPLRHNPEHRSAPATLRPSPRRQRATDEA